MLLFTHTNVNFYYLSLIFYYYNRSGIGQEWERNGSGLLYDNTMIAFK